MRINSLISDNSSYHKLNVICLVSKFANKISTIRHCPCSTMGLSSASMVPGQNRLMCIPLPASYHPPNSSSCKLWNHILSSSASRTSQHFLSLAPLIADQPWAPRFVNSCSTKVQVANLHLRASYTYLSSGLLFCKDVALECTGHFFHKLA